MIQKAILLFRGKNQELIIQEVVQDMVHTCSNPNGLHVAKKLITLCLRPEYEKYQQPVITILAAHCIELAQNPYGNYGMQIVLDSYPAENCVQIIESIKGKIANLSITKYSSNVVERCLEKASPELRIELITELIQASNFIGIVRG